jgi:CheY-like chemotaxis protein
MTKSVVSIVLVEDDDIDAAAVERAIDRARIGNPIVRAHDGAEALDMLLGTNGMARLDQPYLLLVDIRMPRLDGLDLIRAIRAHPLLHSTIVFILTSSDNDRDVIAAYNANVAGYIVKSSDIQYLKLASMLDYYLMIVTPPLPANAA